MAADSMVKATTPEKVGHTDQGLWKHKGWRLPPYIAHVANDLKAKMGESRAIQMAVGIVRNWSEGHDGKGHKVSATTQAAAAKAIGEWEKLKAQAGKGKLTEAASPELTDDERAAMVERAGQRLALLKRAGLAGTSVGAQVDRAIVEAAGFDEHLHPRDLVGKFTAKVAGLKPGESAKLPDGHTVTRQKGRITDTRRVERYVVHQPDGSLAGTRHNPGIHHTAAEAAKTALDSSSRSTHPLSLGGTQRFTTGGAAAVLRHLDAGNVAVAESPRPTYRERREARAERLQGWSEQRAAKAEAAFTASHDATAGIPFGQPIMRGTNSGRAHERALQRAHDAASRGLEHAEKSRGMASRAANIKAAAEHAIYSDDPDAHQRLTERIAELEAKRETMKARNAAFRREHKAELSKLSSFGRGQALPHPPYELSNLGGNISRLRARLASMPSPDDVRPVVNGSPDNGPRGISTLDQAVHEATVAKANAAPKATGKPTATAYFDSRRGRPSRQTGEKPGAWVTAVRSGDGVTITEHPNEAAARAHIAPKTPFGAPATPKPGLTAESISEAAKHVSAPTSKFQKPYDIKLVSYARGKATLHVTAKPSKSSWGGDMGREEAMGAVHRLVEQLQVKGAEVKRVQAARDLNDAGRLPDPVKVFFSNAANAWKARLNYGGKPLEIIVTFSPAAARAQARLFEAAFNAGAHPRGGKGSQQGGKFVAKGSSGTPTRAVQRRVGARVDGQFGNQTMVAVKRFQQAHGLTVDGVVGRQTVAALRGRKDAKRVATGALSAADIAFLTGHVRGTGRQAKAKLTHAQQALKTRKAAAAATSFRPGAPTAQPASTTLIEAVAPAELLDRVKGLHPGEMARCPDGCAVKHHMSPDGRAQWTAGRPSTYGSGDGNSMHWSESHRTPEAATADAHSMSAASRDPASLGGTHRFHRHDRVLAGGRRARFAGVTASGQPLVHHEPVTGALSGASMTDPDGVLTTWPELTPAPETALL